MKEIVLLAEIPVKITDNYPRVLLKRSLDSGFIVYSKIIVLFIFVCFNPAYAKDVSIHYFDFYPVSYEKDGHPMGPAVEVARQVTQGLPVVFEDKATPLKRLLAIMKDEPVITIAIVRNPQRENLYVWVSDLYRDSIVMATVPPTPIVNDLDQARHLQRIVAMGGGTTETLLRQNDLDNIELISEMGPEANLLRAHRVDGWLSTRLAMLSTWSDRGFDPSELQVGASLMDVQFWMVASKTVPRDIVDAIRSRIAALKKDGRYSHFYDELQPWWRDALKAER